MRQKIKSSLKAIWNEKRSQLTKSEEKQEDKKNPILASLAPLAGYSDLPYRSLCAKRGSLLQTTELVSSTGIRHGGIEKSWRYLAIDEKEEGKVFIQLFGANADDFLFAAEKIIAHPILQKAWGIDVNMGCPVPKVVKNGAGSALMANPALAKDIVSRLAKFLGPAGYLLSVKFRRGFLGQEDVSVSFAEEMIESGANLLTMHARFREQYYSGQADWQSIAKVIANLERKGLREEVFFFANGDIKDLQTAKACLEETKADGVCIGRAAEGNPWLFHSFLDFATKEFSDLDFHAKEFSDEEKKADILWHAQAFADFLGEEKAMREFRKALVQYSFGREEAKSLRQKASCIENMQDVKAWLDLF